MVASMFASNNFWIIINENGRRKPDIQANAYHHRLPFASTIDICWCTSLPWLCIEWKPYKSTGRGKKKERKENKPPKKINVWIKPNVCLYKIVNVYWKNKNRQTLTNWVEQSKQCYLPLFTQFFISSFTKKRISNCKYALRCEWRKRKATSRQTGKEKILNGLVHCNVRPTLLNTVFSLPFLRFEKRTETTNIAAVCDQKIALKCLLRSVCSYCRCYCCWGFVNINKNK